MVPHPHLSTALALSVQEWDKLGIEQENEFAELCEADVLERLVERATSLFLIRALAILVKHPQRHFADFSTSTICRTLLLSDKPLDWYAPELTDSLIQNLTDFVRAILSGYNDTPYHCNEHAFHVLLSVNKLIETMLQTEPSEVKTFGLRFDALAHFGMLFSALIHDVEHTGVPNRQLVLENDELAVLYSDQSVAEQRSLFIGFKELLKPAFKDLRTVLFKLDGDKTDSELYRRFRKIVIDLVLNTDIASPERTQLGKSKWKEAFGDTFESLERKLKVSLKETGESDDSHSSAPESSEHDSVDAGDLNRSGHSKTSIQSNADSQDGVIVSSKIPSGNTKAVVVNIKEVDKFGLSETPVEYQKHRVGRGHSMMHRRRSSVQLLQTDDVTAAKFQRRMSSYSSARKLGVPVETFRKRLGIRRSMDLSGEAIEVYSRTSTQTDSDEADELKAFVVMETIMTAADVGHNLQGWDQMITWSGRLYMELRKAYVEKRGTDPQIRWYENQIGFLESYLLPLARRLEDTGVFGDAMEKHFAQIVEHNRDKWVEKGHKVTELIVREGAESYKLLED